ncbi:unnamed protein product [Cunninghamella blakesleeana]
MLRPTFQRIQRHCFHSSVTRNIKVGDKIPSVEVQLSSPGETTNVYDLFKNVKKGILVTVPGAFTPACSKTHLPVNDAFVMTAWGENLNNDNSKVTLLADPTGAFTKAMDLDFDVTKALGNHRSKRSATIIENGVVKHHFVEPDNTGLDVSVVKNVEKYL